MKHRQLQSIAHNFAASLASGMGFVVGYVPTQIFQEAASSKDGNLTIDFLDGRITDGTASKDLRKAVELYREAFSEFCQKHGADISDFRELSVRFQAGQLNNHFAITIEDASGNRSVRKYNGALGERVRELDDRGRIRPKTS
ncbi:MAG: hypothetical protein GKR97_20640 [Rhizobiaceae bacterium]|nr:hypothetical protein [Rhizobiaceae bacterium]